MPDDTPRAVSAETTPAEQFLDQSNSLNVMDGGPQQEQKGYSLVQNLLTRYRNIKAARTAMRQEIDTARNERDARAGVALDAHAAQIRSAETQWDQRIETTQSEIADLEQRLEAAKQRLETQQEQRADAIEAVDDRYSSRMDEVRGDFNSARRTARATADERIDTAREAFWDRDIEATVDDAKAAGTATKNFVVHNVVDPAVRTGHGLHDAAMGAKIGWDEGVARETGFEKPKATKGPGMNPTGR